MHFSKLSLLNFPLFQHFIYDYKLLEEDCDLNQQTSGEEDQNVDEKDDPTKHPLAFPAPYSIANISHATSEMTHSITQHILGVSS